MHSAGLDVRTRVLSLRTPECGPWVCSACRSRVQHRAASPLSGRRAAFSFSRANFSPCDPSARAAHSTPTPRKRGVSKPDGGRADESLVSSLKQRPAARTSRRLRREQAPGCCQRVANAKLKRGHGSVPLQLESSARRAPLTPPARRRVGGWFPSSRKIPSKSRANGATAALTLSLCLLKNLTHKKPHRPSSS